jgi:2-methylisocitrate lyase-like PEP mutase family enzyme
MTDRERAQKLRQRIGTDSMGQRRLLSVPGCFDAFSSMMIAQAGFDTGFVTGGGVSMTRLARPDIGLVSLTDLAGIVRCMRERVDIALIVDGDTGFGNALNMRHSVKLLERAGATAIQIEDQMFPKQCGHLPGKQVIPLHDAQGKIKAALDARDHSLIFARTDALAVEGLNGALDRAEAYLEAGCDGLFIEGPRTMGELQTITTRFARRIPLIHNLVEGGVTPTKSAKDLAQLGIAITLHPLMLLLGYAKIAPRLLASLSDHADTIALEDEIGTLATINELVGSP